MEIVDIAVNNLVPYDKNPRRNDEAAVKVAESIKRFGFKIPLVVDRNNVVVCGHTRLKAAKKLKLKTVPCILADDLSEDQIKAFRLADNRTAEIAEWDFALLEEELADVRLDMTAFDFDDLLAEEEAGSENGQAPVGAEREEESACLTAVLLETREARRSWGGGEKSKDRKPDDAESAAGPFGA